MNLPAVVILLAILYFPPVVYKLLNTNQIKRRGKAAGGPRGPGVNRSDTAQPEGPAQGFIRLAALHGRAGARRVGGRGGAAEEIAVRCV